MIVKHDHGRGRAEQGLAKHIPRLDDRGVQRARCHDRRLSTRCLVSSSTTPNCSTARAPNVGSRNAAASRGMRNCTRAAGPCVSVRRPSSMAASTCAARARPMPPSRASSSDVERARPCRPPHRRSRALASPGAHRPRAYRDQRRAPPVRCRRAPLLRGAAASREDDRLATGLSWYTEKGTRILRKMSLRSRLLPALCLALLVAIRLRRRTAGQGNAAGAARVHLRSLRVPLCWCRRMKDR